MSTLSIRDVAKSYGSFHAMHGVSLDIAEGEFVVPVGPSGCGKSTLLRMISGLEEVTDGEIRIDGRVVKDLHPKDRDIAMVFQNHALYPQMSVEGNMDFSLRLRGMAARPRHERIEGAAGILNIGALLARLPGNLSGGQRQRLATTTVHVTHDQVEAMTMADRIVVMNAGRIEQVGRPLDLYDRPANRFVAGFIGSPAMNVLEAVVRPDGRDAFVTEDGVALPPALSGAAMGPATYGIRPEHVRADPGGVEPRARIVEPTGPEVQVVGEVGRQPFVAVFRDRVLPRPGEVVRIRPDPERVAIFDARGEAVPEPARH